jgi:hypothetical protein
MSDYELTETGTALADLDTRRSPPWWLLFGLLSFGLLAWAGFVYVGLRTHRSRWLAWAGVYLAGAVANIALLSVSNDGSDWQGATGTTLLGVVWIGSLVHGLVIRRDVAERIGVIEDVRIRDARSHELRRSVESDLVRRDPRLAREAGLGTSASDGGLVDLNHAPLELIAALPGVDAATAHRIVAVRERIGGFSSLDDASAVLDFSGPLVDGLRDRVVCVPL